MKLYIKQKVFSLTDKYNVTDETGNPIYVVNREFLSLGAKFHLCDLNGNEIFLIKQKLITFLAEYDIIKDELHYAKIKKQLSFLKPKINVTSEIGSYELTGDVWTMCFEIRSGNSSIGCITKKWLSWGDSYELNIYNDVDAPFFTALVIAIDHCLHNENK